MQTLQTGQQMEQDYKSIKNMLGHIAHQFSKKHGGDVDELFSEASYVFCLAYPKWDEEKSKLTTFMYHSIWRRLIQYRKNQCKKQMCQFSQNEKEEATAAEIPDYERTSGFEVGNFLEQLGEDARTVVKILLNPPQRLRNNAEAKGGQNRNWGSSLRELLKDLAWTKEKIQEAFEEVGEALEWSK